MQKVRSLIDRVGHIRQVRRDRSRFHRLMVANNLKDSIAFLYEDFQECIRNPGALPTYEITRDLLASGVWVGRSVLKYQKAQFDFNATKSPYDSSENARIIIEAVKTGKRLHKSPDEIFQTIFNELAYSYLHESYKTPLQIKSSPITIVLIPGALNELFKNTPFERAVRYVQEKYSIKYFASTLGGIKSSDYNADDLYGQIQEYLSHNPGEKLWLLSYSKGGLDALHFLKKYPEMTRHVRGLSTIASPLLGTDHIDHRIVKILNSIHKLADTKPYQYIDERLDILAKDFQRSISSRYQKMWFQRNHNRLPQGIFYTAVALESNWQESHFLMMLAKLVFNSKIKNDGLVDTCNAQYPHYFNGINFGVLSGHHLIGSQSSFYLQEALVEAQLIYLNYKKLL